VHRRGGCRGRDEPLQLNARRLVGSLPEPAAPGNASRVAMNRARNLDAPGADRFPALVAPIPGTSVLEHA
jgi:hypothetical protein